MASKPRKPQRSRNHQASTRNLLRWAIGYIEVCNASLAECHWHPVSRRIEPASVRREVADTRRWLKRAREAAR